MRRNRRPLDLSRLPPNFPPPVIDACPPIGAAPEDRGGEITAQRPEAIPGRILGRSAVKTASAAEARTSQIRPNASAIEVGNLLDHELIGGRLTICVLFYGEEKFHPLHRKCLNAILASTDPARTDLRVASNALNETSVRMIDAQVQLGRITHHYRNRDNKYKYPVMREMFRDPLRPIDTKWIVWFDDDSIADKTVHWTQLLAREIIAKPAVAMFGGIFYHATSPQKRAWMQGRPWYQGKSLRAANGKSIPNGQHIVFATGGFWALRTDAMLACDIPDADIGHNHGDIIIGEQLHQGGYALGSFNHQKSVITTSSVPRRGVTLPPPGSKEHAVMFGRP